MEWQPYGAGESLGYTADFRLNPMYLRDKDLWLMRCPLICNWAVEFHLPHRVYRQFGLFQPHPPDWVDTGTGVSDTVQPYSSATTSHMRRPVALATASRMAWDTP